MKYKIEKAPAGRWGEGYQVGDIVSFDEEAARVPLEKGEISEFIEEVQKKEIQEEQVEEKYICSKCGKECKSKIGLVAHEKKCQK